MIESPHVLSQATQTVPKQIRPRLDYAEVTQQPVVIRAFGLAVGEEYGIEYSLSPSDNKWIPYSPNGSQKKITTLFNPIAVATPGRYRVIPLTAVSSCARFDFIAGTGTHEWLLEYQEPTVVVNTTTTPGGGSVNFATRVETLAGGAVDLAVHPDGLAQAIQHQGYVYAEPSGVLANLSLALTPPLVSYANTSILITQLDQDSGGSPQNFTVDVDGLGQVPVLSTQGVPLFANEVPPYYSMLLLWRNDHFELLNPGDFQEAFTWTFSLDPGVVISTQSGVVFKVSNLDRTNPVENGRGVQINAYVQMTVPNVASQVQVILPFASAAFSSFAIASVYTSAALGGVVSALLPDASGALSFFFTPFAAPSTPRPLRYDDLFPFPDVELSFSLTYAAALP